MKPKTKLGKLEKTCRGFSRLEFTDVYGAECSIQQSSAACYDAIWLGVNDGKPQIMASQAGKLGVKTNETTGWIPYPVPEEVFINTRMHLNEGQVKGLITHLQNWLKTKEF